MKDDWRTMLRATRRMLSLTQRELAGRAGMSVEAVRAYEDGRRNPSREHLGRLLSALEVDRAWRNRLLLAAGFAPDGMEQRPANIDEWWFTVEEAKEEIERYHWPSFVLAERGEVTWANAAAQGLWGVDMTTEFLDPIERNLLSVATMPRFADRCANWDEAVATLLWMFKAYHRGAENPEDPSPYFAAVLQRFMEGDPKYVAMFGELWERATDAYPAKIRLDYPIVWEQPGVGTLRFKCIVSTMNEPDGISVHDWIPADAATWEALGRVVGREPVREARA
jgi:transcriptional regulator with XRE-family HTH domain